MKKQLTKLALTATLGLAITLALNACGKGGGDAKLLEAITDENGNIISKYEYDKQNRIVKIGDKTITYANNLITVGTEKFVINGNTVTIEDRSFPIDKDGYLANVQWVEYTYKDGNLIHALWNESAYTDDYSYDDKKSPFSNCNTPKWLIQRLLGNASASKNNVVEYVGENGSVTSKYEYDSDGFPVKVTVTTKFEDNEETTITRYTYRGEKEAAKTKADAEAQAVKAMAEAEAEARIKAQAEADIAAYEAQEARKAYVKANGGTFTDSRDKKTYKTIKIGEQIWMAENLNIKTGNSVCYEDKEDNCKEYGRLYDWETAMKACPSGWHLPDTTEWNILVVAVGGKETVGKYLKAKIGWNDNEGNLGNGEDKFGFSALPGGFYDDCEGDCGGGFGGFGVNGRWWSSSTNSENGSDYVYRLYMYYGSEDVDFSGDLMSYLYSVRCIQN